MSISEKRYSFLGGHWLPTMSIYPFRPELASFWYLFRLERAMSTLLDGRRQRWGERGMKELSLGGREGSLLQYVHRWAHVIQFRIHAHATPPITVSKLYLVNLAFMVLSCLHARLLSVCTREKPTKEVA